MNSKLKQKCLLFFLSFICLKGFPQETDYSKVNLASPNAASLGKFVDIPVNKHTGIPSINIPLYTVEEGNLKLPISASYHAGGIKVTESSSWIGAGWALNAGGVISRSVKGIPDEATNTQTGQYGHFINYGYSNYFARSLDPLLLNDVDFETKIRDGEPDLFFFNFNGYSGTFFFNDDRTAVILSDEDDLKIETHFQLANTGGILGMNNNIQGFTITTKEGTKYHFGKYSTVLPSTGYTYPVEVSRPYTTHNGLSGDVIFSSWYLSKIESQDGKDNIDFLYLPEKYSLYEINLFPIFNPDNIALTKGHELVRNYVDGVRLAEINFSDGKVIFKPGAIPREDVSGNNGTGYSFEESANTESKALDEIEIRSNTETLKGYKFYTSYFTDNSPLNGGLNLYSNSPIISDKKHLRLDSLTETDGGSIKQSPYKFIYSTNTLSRRLSLSQDHWGFYNGAPNITLIPTITKDNGERTVYNGANRDAKWPEMANGSLKEIVYPTKGSIVFEFEPHKAYLDATKTNLEYINSYSVGYDGSYSKIWDNIEFTENAKYQLIYSNTLGQTPGGSYSSNYYLKNKATGASISYSSVAAGETKTYYVYIPAGIYTLEMYRNGAYSGTGATLSFSKVVLAPIQDPIVGGLRIKSITKKSGNAMPDILESYSYETNGRSTGYLYERPRYILPIRNETVKQFGFRSGVGTDYQPNPYPEGCISVVIDNFGASNIISPFSIVPMSSSQGNHIGYDEVAVKQTGPQNVGSTVYRFYNVAPEMREVTKFAYTDITEGCDVSAPYYPEVPAPFEFQRGELKEEVQLDRNGKFKKSVAYLYSYDSTKVFTPALKIEHGLFTEYMLRGYWKKRIETITSVASSNGEGTITTVDTMDFNSPYHHQLVRKVTENSSGRTETIFKYAFDFRMPAVEAISDGWSAYLNECLTYDNEDIQRASGCGGDWNCVFMSFERARASKAEARKRYITYRLNNFLNSSSTYKNTFSNNKQNSDSRMKPIWELQERHINALVESVEKRNGLVINATLNKFNYFDTGGQNFVYPSGTMALDSQKPVAGFLGTSNTNTALTINANYKDKTNLNFNNGRIILFQERLGPTTSYLWDYSGQYPVAEAKNTSQANIAYTSFEADAKGNWSYTGIPGADATAPTGHKVYNLSMGAVSKSGLSSSKTYILQYWAKSAVATSISGGPAIAIRNHRGWTQYQRVVTGVTSLSIGGSVALDDIRLYPQEAAMTTYTYDPLVGMTSKTDEKGALIYYEYDGFQRLKAIRDLEGKVIETYDYHYKQP